MVWFKTGFGQFEFSLVLGWTGPAPNWTVAGSS